MCSSRGKMKFEMLVILAIFASCPIIVHTQYTFKTNTPLNNIFFYGGEVYIGAVNYIYRLNSNLVEIKKIKIGPELDSRSCSTKSDVECGDKKLTNNTNKVLLLFSLDSNTKLFTCGSLFQGTCQIRNPKTLDVTTNGFRDVAANDAHSSTIGFVTKVPQDDGKFSQMLSIAVTQSKRLDSMKTPTVTIRWVDETAPRKFLRVASSQNIKAKKTFEVDYVSGFSISGVSYFTAIRPTKVGSKVYMSEIIRFCPADRTLNTYTEMPMVCKDSKGINYNILVAGSIVKATGISAKLFNVTEGEEVYLGVFSKSDGDGKVQTDNNIVCSYSFSDIEAAFLANLKECLYNKKPANGGMSWLFATRTTGCKEANKEYQRMRNANPNGKGVVSLSCSQMAVLRNFAQGGTIPLNATNSFHIPGKPSSIQGYPHSRGFSVFIGTHHGNVMKYSLSESLKIHRYTQDLISSDRIQKIVVGPSNTDLFVMSMNKLVKMTVKDCSQRNSCVDCLAGPYCGWCSLQKKCSLKSECKNSDRPLYFIEDSQVNCPHFISVEPQAVAVKISNKVKWTIKGLPVLQSGEQYSCLFGEKAVTATVSGSEYSCAAPKAGEISATGSTKRTSLKVTFQSPYIQSSLFATEVDFYNCGVINSCLECTKFKYKCNWCSSSVSCLDEGVTCASPILHAGPDQSTSSSKCPRVTGISTSLVANGVDRQIVLPGDHFPIATAGHKFECQVLLNGSRTMTTTAKRKNSNTVICDKKAYTLQGKDAMRKAKVSVLFGGKTLDTTSETTVTIYKCDVDRDDCSICLDAPRAWQCGWCNKKHCSVADACISNWLNESCPSPPTILNFSPMSGAVFGSTELKINGRDLGKAKEDIGNITVAGQPCQFLPKLYVPSKTIICKTSPVSKPVSGKVQVNVKFGEEMLKIKSSKEFMYKKPSFSYFEPTKAPCSGGTLLTIHGTNLAVGAKVHVTVAGKACQTKRRIPEKITCMITSTCGGRKRRVASSNSVTVSFDGTTIPPSNSATFEFKPDPVVIRINTYKPRTVDEKILETFISGGQVFLIKGERLNIIQDPRMKFTLLSSRNQFRYGTCRIRSSNGMNCIAPNMTDLAKQANESLAVELGFLMQNVKSVLRLQNITVRPDPVFFKFTEKRDLQSRNLVLKGTNLDILGNEDVNVTVANFPCVVQNIRETLFCIAPNSSTLQKHKDGAIVKVRIGEGGLQYTLGFIRYVSPTFEAEPFPWLYIYIAGAIVFVFILVIIVLVVLYRRRQKKEKKYQKVFETRLDNLESRYARECKEAFAELQTEMTDLTTDLSTSAIPYLDFETYAVRLLFPGLDSHPIMEKDCNKSDSWKRCMSSLCELLKEKEFLLIYVKTLESQQAFIMRDRCKVASLLMVALQDDIKYVTDILQELLSDLIEKSVNSGRAKLLLRRTESVAEKLLTNWLSYTLYEFLQQRVGEPLFRLFSAIGSLLDKEPVDFITSEARNSLSEDRLLRQKVDFKTITAHVEYNGDDSVTVQLLNCDSINQAKEKILNFIYKNVPYSQRPNKDSLVLVYLTPTGGEKILHQEDSTCEIDGEWKRINTLEHFLIPDGCQLKLIQFAVYSDGTSTPVFHDMSVPNVMFTPAHSSTPMLNNHHHRDEDFKLWHLVKSSDYPVEQKEDPRQNKMMAEVYLTRLLKTKGTLQNFVDDLFDAVFSVTKRNSPIPPVMKFLFDFLDKQAELLGITDSEVLHTWKNNSLPLKFWINIIKNPNFVFDVYKTGIVDSCLSVTAQLFMDSCSPEEHRLGKDSASNKLLYAKEFPEYKKKVARFYSEVKSLPAAKDKELNESLSDISNKYGAVFNHYNAASELLTYAVKHKVKIMDALENEDLEEYAEKLQKIMETLPDD